MDRDLNTPLWQLTVGEFLELQKKEAAAPKEILQVEDKYVYGLDGIARLFGCSKRSASILKAGGKIDKAIIQDGRKIIVDSKLALELAKKRK